MSRLTAIGPVTLILPNLISSPPCKRCCLRVLVLTLALFALSPIARAVTPAPDGGSPNDNTVEENAALFSPATGVYTWSTTTTGFAWLNATHWTGNPGHYPGVDANGSSTGDGASNDVAAFSSMAFSATILGINFSPSSNNGVNNNTGANGSLILGAIDYLSTTNKSISIGDNSGTAGTLTLTGVTLNGVANTVLANEGSHSLTLAPQIGGALKI